MCIVVMGFIIGFEGKRKKRMSVRENLLFLCLRELSC